MAPHTSRVVSAEHNKEQQERIKKCPGDFEFGLPEYQQSALELKFVI